MAVAAPSAKASNTSGRRLWVADMSGMGGDSWIMPFLATPSLNRP